MLKFVILLAVVGVVVGEYSAAKHAECILAHNAVQENVMNFLLRKDYSESDSSLKCLYKCLFHKTGVVDDSGEFSADRFVDNMLLLPQQILDIYRPQIVAHVENCNNGATFSLNDPCDKAFKKMLCFITD